MHKVSDKIYIRDITIQKDKYLDSHRFASTPYFPFVMGMEFFCQVCNELRLDAQSILFSDFKVHGPLMFRRDRDKRVELHVEHCEHYDIISIRDHSSEFISGKLAARTSQRQKSRVEYPHVEKMQNQGNILDRDFLYPNVFPHGPHFQSQFELHKFSEQEMIVSQFGFNNSLTYIDNETIESLTFNPALLDGILQMCSYYSALTNNCFLLPISTDACYVEHSIKDQLDSVVLRIVPCGEAAFDVYCYCNKTQEIVVEFKNVKFAQLKKKISL